MLEILYRLQKLETMETALMARQKNCEEFQQLRDLKTEFEALKQTLLQRQEELLELQEQMQSLPDELADIEEKIAQERAALYDGSIGNIRELTARQGQITALEERSTAMAGELAKKQSVLRRLMHQAKTLQQRLTEQHQQFTEQYRRYETLRDGWQNELDLLAADKEELLSTINEQDLAWYEEQKPLFGGLPVAGLDKNHVCDGCRTMVTPMLYKRTVFGERTRCEKCGRYLFIKDETAP